MDGDVVAARADMPLGHKVARAFIPAGALVVKYGMPIGSATADIEPGDWVHLHNMRSNYISRSEEHTSELQSIMRNSYAVFCLKQKNKEEKQTTKQGIQHDRRNEEKM